MQNRRTRKDQAGFTLLETIMAMLVLGVGLIALAQLVAIAINQNAMSRTTSVGITVAQGKLEELRTDYNAGLNTGVTPGDVAAGPHGPQTIVLPSGYGTGTKDYLVNWTITDLYGSEKTVEVTVRPKQGSFLNSRSVSITSHFAP